MNPITRKIVAVALGPLMALAVYGGVARSQSTCTTALGSQDGVFFPSSSITVIKGSGASSDALIFNGILVNEDPVIECFQGLDPVNGCSGPIEQADDFITGVPSANAQGLAFIINNNNACNLSSVQDAMLINIGSFHKVNNGLATFNGTVSALTIVGGAPGATQTVTVKAKVWRVGWSAGPPNFNYTDGTCGAFHFWVEVSGADLQGINLAQNPMTLSIQYGDEVGLDDSQSFACFQTTKAAICSSSGTGAVKGASDEDCRCALSGDDSAGPVRASGDDEGCGDDLHGGNGQDGPLRHSRN